MFQKSFESQCFTFTKKFLLACQDAANWNEELSPLPKDLSPSILYQREKETQLGI